MTNRERTREELTNEIAGLRSRIVELEALQHRGAPFFSILQKAPYGVILIEKDGSYTYVNPEFTHITGYALEDVPSGRALLYKAYPDPAYQEQVRKAWRNEVMRKGVNWIFSFVCKDGSIKEIEFRPTLLEDGRAIIMLSDVTGRKRAEEWLKRTREELEDRFRERTAELSRSNELLELEMIERSRMEEALR